MEPLKNDSFGLLIAYVLPGFTVLWGASHFSDILRSWLSSNPAELPTVGGFLYVTLGSVAVGMTLSTIRWLLIDRLHHLTGLKAPQWDFSQLASKVEAFGVLIRIHYLVYQFNANMLVAIIFAYTMRKAARFEGVVIFGWEDAAWLLIAVVLFSGSRDTLRKYYLRVEGLLSNEGQKNG